MIAKTQEFHPRHLAESPVHCGRYSVDVTAQPDSREAAFLALALRLDITHIFSRKGPFFFVATVARRWASAYPQGELVRTADPPTLWRAWLQEMWVRQGVEACVRDADPETENSL